MKLNNDPFTKIKNGSKKIELRLYDNKRKLLKVNDIIEFTNISNNEKLLVSIINLTIYKNFKELFNNIDITSLGYNKNDNIDYTIMNNYYSIEEQNKYGVIAIEIRKIN